MRLLRILSVFIFWGVGIVMLLLGAYAIATSPKTLTPAMLYGQSTTTSGVYTGAVVGHYSPDDDVHAVDVDAGGDE